MVINSWLKYVKYVEGEQHLTYTTEQSAVTVAAHFSGVVLVEPTRVLTMTVIVKLIVKQEEAVSSVDLTSKKDWFFWDLAYRV